MTFPKRSILIAAFLTFVFSYPDSLKAWGALGHKTIAWIAQDRLNSKARRSVRELLGQDRDLPSISTWADAIVHLRPETAPWHYLNLDVREGQGQFDLEIACRYEDCIVGQINKDVRILREPFGKKGVKREALKFLVHFVGDLHQPLHCADDNDRGGNEKWFTIPSKKGNKQIWICLHKYWDDLFETQPSIHPPSVGSVHDDGFETNNTQSSREMANRLESGMDPNDESNWVGGTPEQWAYESFLIAQKNIYDELPRGPLPKNRWGRDLPEDYENGKMKFIMEHQLEKAGVRLAYLLNDVLGQ